MNLSRKSTRVNWRHPETPNRSSWKQGARLLALMHICCVCFGSVLGHSAMSAQRPDQCPLWPTLRTQVAHFPRSSQIRRRSVVPSEPCPVPHSAGVSFVSRIVLRVHGFEAQRTDGRYLSDVLAGLCPVEVPRVAGQTMTLPGGYAVTLSPSNRSPKPM